ncbi:thiosulfate oxidation carrier complex protein SoxZ [Methylomonas sp. LL1]|nr:thiosulfate oxidation carrier complex protein SoxZ [Methylomonas sp. LL1]
MASSIKIRSQRLDDYTEIKLLISHPMENGRNRDPLTNELIPAHFIRELLLQLNGASIIRADLGGSMSKNPFFSFRLKNSRGGDSLRVSWVDNLDQTDSAEHNLD